MRASLALALLSLLAAPAAAQSGPPGSRGWDAHKARCPDAAIPHYAVSRDRPTARTLDREPPGKLILTVQREVNGCPELAVVRSNIGLPTVPRPGH